MANETISDAEIQQDILDTQREIADMEAERIHLEGTPATSSDYRWNMMRADARRTGIAERRQFITNLENILKIRAGN